MCVRFEYQNILNVNREKHLKMETELSKQRDPAFGQQCKDGFRAGPGASITASKGSWLTPLWSFPSTYISSQVSSAGSPEALPPGICLIVSAQHQSQYNQVLSSATGKGSACPLLSPGSQCGAGTV